MTRLAIGFDPGERHLGWALIAYEPRRLRADPHNDLLYHVRAYELWDLKRGGDGSRTACLRRLAALLTNPRHPLLWPLLLDPEVDVFIEHQEGFNLNRPEIGAALMPMCAYAGAIFAVYAGYGHRCVMLTGKKSKWGWTSFIHTRDYALLASDDAKRARRKACATHYTWDLIERQVADAQQRYAVDDLRLLAVQYMAARYQALPFDDKAHIADSILLVMFQVRKRFRKAPPNVIRNANWPTLAARAEIMTPATGASLTVPHYKGRKKFVKKKRRK